MGGKFNEKFDIMQIDACETSQETGGLKMTLSYQAFVGQAMHQPNRLTDCHLH